MSLNQWVMSDAHDILQLLRETLAARLTRTLGSLLQNGVPLIPALGIAKDALGNLAAAAAVEAAALGAKGGAGLARPLAAAGLFPARTILASTPR